MFTFLPFLYEIFIFFSRLMISSYCVMAAAVRGYVLPLCVRLPKEFDLIPVLKLNCTTTCAINVPEMPVYYRPVS
jgi:hypothetical protein